MAKQWPLRIYYSLSELENRWQVSITEIGQWLIHGHLKAHVWLPSLSYYEITEEAQGNQILQQKRLCHQDGYLVVFPHDCRNVLRFGKTELREFSSECGTLRYCLHETLPGFPVGTSDLVVLTSEVNRFEESYDLCSKTLPANTAFLSTPIDFTFRTIMYHGRPYQFGQVQAAIIRLLYEASLTSSPWLNGKQLLAQAGSRSFTLANIFKRRPIWKQLIESDGGGYYRLNITFAASMIHPRVSEISPQ